MFPVCGLLRFTNQIPTRACLKAPRGADSKWGEKALKDASSWFSDMPSLVELDGPSLLHSAQLDNLARMEQVMGDPSDEIVHQGPLMKGAA